MSERDSDAQVLVGAQAAEWFVLLRDGELSAAEQRRYLEWLRRSPAHVAEMARIEQLHNILKNALDISNASLASFKSIIRLSAK